MAGYLYQTVLVWSETYFSGMAYQYPGLAFDFARNDEPSMYRQVTETDFPMPKSYLELVLRCLEAPYSVSTVYATE